MDWDIPSGSVSSDFEAESALELGDLPCGVDGSPDGTEPDPSTGAVESSAAGGRCEASGVSAPSGSIQWHIQPDHKKFRTPIEV